MGVENKNERKKDQDNKKKLKKRKIFRRNKKNLKKKTRAHTISCYRREMISGLILDVEFL